MFAPKWYKEAKLLLKGSQKFLDYKRDLLTEERIAEIKSRQQDLKSALKDKDQTKVTEASRQLQAYCEKSMPRHMEQTGWQEQVEVIFVALVIALGLRTFFLQPFRIPTGSMQPTLNGIIIAPPNTTLKEPWIGQQAVDWILKGRTYQNVIADSDMYSTARAELGTLRDASWFLFTKTEVTFSTASGPKKLTFPAPPGEVQKQLLDKTGRPILFKKGQHIIGSYIDTGDLVLVDKFSYHFRRPKRGEVFVFDTRGIQTERPSNDPSKMKDQEGGTHFIKRLVGVPGDTLEIRSPELIVNGTPAHEFGMQRVAKAEGIYHEKNPGGYILGNQDPSYPCPLSLPGSQLHLAALAPPGKREYAAMGDNTGNSLDSRYWGTVKEFNLAGPALLALWPFTSGHWGIIR